MDRFIRFYEEVFDAETKFDLSEPGPGGGAVRHALIDLVGGFALHSFQMPEPTGYEDGSMQMGKRGHIDHLALNVDDEVRLQEVRRRLVKAGASDGTITDFGAIRLVTFRDPDGMEGEVARWTDSKRVLGFDERKREMWPDNNGEHPDIAKVRIGGELCRTAQSGRSTLLVDMDSLLVPDSSR